MRVAWPRRVSTRPHMPPTPGSQACRVRPQRIPQRESLRPAGRSPPPSGQAALPNGPVGCVGPAGVCVRSAPLYAPRRDLICRGRKGRCPAVRPHLSWAQRTLSRGAGDVAPGAKDAVPRCKQVCPAYRRLRPRCEGHCPAVQAAQPQVQSASPPVQATLPPVQAMLFQVRRAWFRGASDVAPGAKAAVQRAGYVAPRCKHRRCAHDGNLSVGLVDRN